MREEVGTTARGGAGFLPDASAPQRRTQAERSHATQQRILSVTLELLLEKGLRDTSTVDVARTAGISRGALLHHYPSRQALLQEALRHRLNAEIADTAAMAEAIKTDEMDLDGFLHEMWRRFSGSLFMITMEFLTAARTDPAIREALVPVAQDYNRQLDEIWDRLLADIPGIRSQRRVALNATLCLLRGMATQSIWRDEPQVFLDMLEFWKNMLNQTALGQSEAT